MSVRFSELKSNIILRCDGSVLGLSVPFVRLVRQAPDGVFYVTTRDGPYALRPDSKGLVSGFSSKINP